MRKFLGLLFSSFAVSVILCGSVFAEEPPTTKIVLEPSSLRFALNPGDRYPASFTVRNTGDIDYDFSVYAEPFAVDDYYENLFDQPTAFTQISRWITFDVSDFHLEANSSTTVHFYVDVPADAPAGGQYAAVFAQIANDDPASAINLNHRVGVLLYSTVTGQTEAHGEIDFLPPTFLQTSHQLKLTEIAHNRGNLDYDASTHLVITKALTGELIEEINTTPHIILPHTSRPMEYSLENLPFGLYKIQRSQEIFGINSESTHTVLVFPFPYLIFSIIIVLSLIGITIRQIRRNSRKKQLIQENTQLRQELDRLKTENSKPNPT